MCNQAILTGILSMYVTEQGSSLKYRKVCWTSEYWVLCDLMESVHVLFLIFVGLQVYCPQCMLMFAWLCISQIVILKTYPLIFFFSF